MTGSRRAPPSTSSDGGRQPAAASRLAGPALALALALVAATAVSARSESSRHAAVRRVPARQDQAERRAPARAPAPRPAARPPAGRAPQKSAPATPPPAAPAAPPAGRGHLLPEQRRAAAEYALLQAELKVAQSKDAYLVFQWEPQPQLLIKVQGAVVENCAVRVDGGSGDVQRFRERFGGGQDRVLRAVSQKYLYTARPQTPDSVLTIVGNVLKLDPQVMQREVPGWFELKWQDDLVLEVRADVDGKPLPGVDLKTVKLQQTLRRPFGETRLRVHLDRRDALTLYRLAHAGFPTLSPAY